MRSPSGIVQVYLRPLVVSTLGSRDPGLSRKRVNGFPVRIAVLGKGNIGGTVGSKWQGRHTAFKVLSDREA
jgi:hypothetical protein